MFKGVLPTKKVIEQFYMNNDAICHNDMDLIQTLWFHELYRY